MEAFVIGVIVIFLIIAFAYAIGHSREQKETLKKVVNNQVSQDETTIHKRSSGVTYLGGHPPFGQPFKDGGMILTDKRILFYQDMNQGVFKIPLENITEVSCETQERLTATRECSLD